MAVPSLPSLPGYALLLYLHAQLTLFALKSRLNFLSQGIPSYNDVREAYGFSRVNSFAEITADTAVQDMLAQAHGNDLDLLDAYTGALAETEEDNALFAGPLLRVSGIRITWKGQGWGWVGRRG